MLLPVVVRKGHTELVSQFLGGMLLYRKLILICHFEVVEYKLFTFFLSLTDTVENRIPLYLEWKIDLFFVLISTVR